MEQKSAAFLMRTFVVIVSIAATCLPAVRNQVPVPNQTTTDQSASAPIVVAQGRCFNGRCY